jgi:hypothetical protein
MSVGTGSVEPWATFVLVQSPFRESDRDSLARVSRRNRHTVPLSRTDREPITRIHAGSVAHLDICLRSCVAS